MAKQRSQYYIGRQAQLVYYMWRGGYYIRTRSTLSGKRFWKYPAFAASRKRAVEFGEAAKLAAEVYQLLPAELRKRGVMSKLTGLVHKELLSGKPKEGVKLELLAAYGLLPKDTLTKQSPAAGGPALLPVGKQGSLTEIAEVSTWQVNKQGVMHTPPGNGTGQSSG